MSALFITCLALFKVVNAFTSWEVFFDKLLDNEIVDCLLRELSYMQYKHTKIYLMRKRVHLYFINWIKHTNCVCEFQKVTGLFLLPQMLTAQQLPTAVPGVQSESPIYTVKRTNWRKTLKKQHCFPWAVCAWHVSNPVRAQFLFQGEV